MDLSVGVFSFDLCTVSHSNGSSLSLPRHRQPRSPARRFPSLLASGSTSSRTKVRTLSTFLMAHRPPQEPSPPEPSDHGSYDGNNELSSSPPPSSGSSPLVLYSPPTVWSLLRGAAINLLLPFVNGLMLGFGELVANELAFRLGWSGTKVRSCGSAQSRRGALASADCSTRFSPHVEVTRGESALASRCVPIPSSGGGGAARSSLRIQPWNSEEHLDAYGPCARHGAHAGYLCMYTTCMQSLESVLVVPRPLVLSLRCLSCQPTA